MKKIVYFLILGMTALNGFFESAYANDKCFCYSKYNSPEESEIYAHYWEGRGDSFSHYQTWYEQETVQLVINDNALYNKVTKTYNVAPEDRKNKNVEDPICFEGEDIGTWNSPKYLVRKLKSVPANEENRCIRPDKR